MTQENSKDNLKLNSTGPEGLLWREEWALIECPRDAMQGWKHFIPTTQD